MGLGDTHRKKNGKHRPSLETNTVLNYRKHRNALIWAQNTKYKSRYLYLSELNQDVHGLYVETRRTFRQIVILRNSLNVIIFRFIQMCRNQRHNIHVFQRRNIHELSHLCKCIPV